jgi:tetratricopeptide (TPR) repeat protein
MADITLRSYFEEIDGLIDGSRVEEAIAHLKHILGIYPKALDAYRLLAKALLEKNRHLDAADVFQRVLSSVPDDFIAHIGMAVVREDEGNLDAAIWHMERAYEVQPSSVPIQEELRRLYGKRDGVEPPRLRLSRAALARMYEKGDLYQQAIGELRVALRDEPDRLDLKVMLATVLWRSRQRAEAAETSAKLLEILPFCRDANRILADIWTESGRPQEAQNYRRRLEALDPYEAFAEASHNGHGATLVQAEQVVVPHLDNVYGQTATDTNRPDWMEALGIQYDQPAATAAPAAGGEWLNALAATADSPAQAGSAPQAPSGTDWLSTLRGEGLPSTGPLVAPDAASAAKAAPPAAPADAPDWLSGLGVTSSPQTPSEQTKSPGESANWLSDMMGGAASVAPVQQERPVGTGMTGWLSALAGDDEPAAPANTEVPDWLRNETTTSDAAQPAPPAPLSEPPPMEQPEAASDSPDWLAQYRSDSALPGEPAGSSILDGDTETYPWPSQSDTTTSESAQPAGPPTQPGAVYAESAEIPDWLQAPTIDGAAPGAPAAENVPDWLAGSSDENPDVKGDVPDWLVAPANDNTPSASRPREQPGAAELPAWLQAADVEPSAQTSEPTAPPDWLNASQLAGAQRDSAPQGVPAWIDQGAQSATDNQHGNTLDWLQNGEAPASNAPADAPSWLDQTAADHTAAELPSWLAAPADAPAGANTTTAAAIDDLTPDAKAAEMARADEEIPDWMKTAGWVPRDPSIPLDAVADPVETPAEPVEPEAAPAEMPDWLQALKPPEAAPPATAAIAAADAPDWLRQAMQGQAQDPAGLDETGDEEPPLLASVDDLPDWLRSASSDPSETVTNFLKAKPGAAVVASPGAGLDWLESNKLPPSQPAEAAALEPAPDWLQSPGKNTAEVVATFLKEQTPEAVDADVSTHSTSPAPSSPADMSADEAMAWLETLAAQHGANEEELVTRRAPSPVAETHIAESEVPASTSRQPDLTAVAETAPLHTAKVPEQIPFAGVSADGSNVDAGLAQAAMSDDEALAWLEGLAARQGVDPKELVSDSRHQPAEAGEIPLFLPAGGVAEQPVELAPTESMDDAQALAWLDTLGEQTAGKSTPASAAGASEVLGEKLSAARVDTTPVEAASSAEMSADEALAWLESLAIRQGASSDELVSKPDSRTDQLPKWIQQESRETQAPPEEAPQIEETVEIMPIESETSETAGAAAPGGLDSSIQDSPPAGSPAPDMSADQAMAWLESLAARQGAAAEELVTDPGIRNSETPDWITAESRALEQAGAELPLDADTQGASVQSVGDETLPDIDTDRAAQSLKQSAAAAGADGLAESTSEWLQTVVTPALSVQVESNEQAPAGGAVEADIEAKPAWLAQMEAEADEYEAVSQGAAPAPESADSLPDWLSMPVATADSGLQPPSDSPSVDQAGNQDLPAWLKASAPEPEEVTPPRLVPAWKSKVELPPSQAEPVHEEAAPQEVLPAWLQSEPPDTASEALPDWLAATSAEVEPTIWVPLTETAPEPEVDVLPAKPSKKTKAPRKPRPSRAGKLRRAGEPAQVLDQARQQLAETNLNSALEIYGDLVASGHFNAEIIADLESANRQQPGHPELLRTLGDAYMRANQLQKALDAYKRALQQL